MIMILLDTDLEPRIILGKVSRNWRPIRNPQSKYLMTKAEYPGDKYPDFATGPSYLVSRQAVLEILPLAMEQQYIHLEDVFLTGVVAESLGIQRLNVKEFQNNPKRIPIRFMGCKLTNIITLHKVDPEDQIKLQELARNRC